MRSDSSLLILCPSVFICGDSSPDRQAAFDKLPHHPENLDMDPQQSHAQGLPDLKFDANGLIPAIVQDHRTGEVLMMAWMNRDALERTIRTGKTYFYSRSRNKLWLKGESSGHVQHVKSIRTDCDADVLLIAAEQVGAACHDGYYSCFYRERAPEGGGWRNVGKKVFDPAKVYT